MHGRILFAEDIGHNEMSNKINKTLIIAPVRNGDREQ